MEAMRVSGNRLLCKKPENDRTQKRGELLIPQQGGGGKAGFRRQQEQARPLEAVIVARGSGLWDNQGRSLDAPDVEGMDPMFQPGKRIAVSNALVSPVYLNGDLHFIVEAADVLGVIAEEGDPVLQDEVNLPGKETAVRNMSMPTGAVIVLVALLMGAMFNVPPAPEAEAATPLLPTISPSNEAIYQDVRATLDVVAERGASYVVARPGE